MTDEDRTREALDWAIDETPLKLPPRLKNPYAWEWDADNVQLRCLTPRGEFLFHVAAERRGPYKTRIAVLSIKDDAGSLKWEADMRRDGMGED
jgi:hypothetical protein